MTQLFLSTFNMLLSAPLFWFWFLVLYLSLTFSDPHELQIFSITLKSYEQSALLVVRKRELFAKRQASVRELYLIQEYLHPHVLLKSVRYGTPINWPSGRLIANQGGRKMVHPMVSYEHYRIQKYQHIMDDQRRTTAIEVSSR